GFGVFRRVLRRLALKVLAQSTDGAMGMGLGRGCAGHRRTTWQGASLIVLCLLGLGGAVAPAAAQFAQPQSSEPQVQGLPSTRYLVAPDTTPPPNSQPAAAPALGHPTFNPFRRPIRTDPLGAWQSAPRIEGRETFDSNPTGAPRGATRPDGYSSLLPGVSITRQSDRNTF